MNNHVSRAKQFLAYDSLKGFKSYLKKKERIIIKRKELLVDAKDELDWKLKQIKIGKMLRVVYYDVDNYVSDEGMVTDLNLELKKLIIVDRVINILDIVQIESNYFN